MKIKIATASSRPRPYRLDDQVGFVLRQASQRHATIFAEGMGGDVTPTQWAAMAKLSEVGPTSQNQLGRMTAMDVATIKGVVDRLTKRGFTASEPDPGDARRHLVALTPAGVAFVAARAAAAHAISAETLAPLDAAERARFLALLAKLK
jgi:DNA-binding MarR family transcriptional regulator